MASFIFFSNAVCHNVVILYSGGGKVCIKVAVQCLIVVFVLLCLSFSKFLD